MPASRHSTAIARLGEGRAAPEFEAITEFLVDTTRAGPRTGGGRCRADGRREKVGIKWGQTPICPVYAGRSDGYSPSGRGGLQRQPAEKKLARKSGSASPRWEHRQNP